MPSNPLLPHTNQRAEACQALSEPDVEDYDAELCGEQRSAGWCVCVEGGGEGGGGWVQRERRVRVRKRVCVCVRERE